MHTKSWIFMRILLNRFHSTSKKEFLSLMPSEEAQEIINQRIESTEIDPVFVNPSTFLNHIHFSWIAPYVQKYPLHIQELLVTSLPQPLSNGLKKFLKLPSSLPSIPSVAGEFLIKKLYMQVRDPDVLAAGFLPLDDLSGLLELSRTELIQMIDYLGLYDLADTVRHLVDKKSLQAVYACMDQKKMQFLRTCLHQKSKFTTTKMDLQKWNSDCHVLHKMLHQRGLYRLGKALTGSHPHFLWHFFRKLDTGRGSILKKYSSSEVNPAARTALIQQTISVLNFLKTKSEA